MLIQVATCEPVGRSSDQSTTGDPAVAAAAVAAGGMQPSIRTVVCGGFARDSGFIVFTSKHSRKAKSFAINDRAAVHAFWPHVSLQVSAAVA